MCDFSAYGGPSKEWLAVQATLPPPKASTMPAVERRSTDNAVREQISAAAMKTLASQVCMADYAIPTRDGATIEARTYRAAADTNKDNTTGPLYIHLHGGGYLTGTLASEDALCARLALATGLRILNVNYRHTPEYTYPTAWDDVQDALVWVHAQAAVLGVDPARVVVGGISAGAHLTASLAIEQKRGRLPQTLPPPAGLVLMIPCLAHMDCYGPQLAKLTDPAVSSYRENEHAPLLDVEKIRYVDDILMAPGSTPDAADIKLNPVNAQAVDVQGLPPTVFGVCGLDPLRDEGLLFAKLLTEEGVPTNINLFKGVPHGFRPYGDKLVAGRAWDEVLEKGILWTLSQPKASGKFEVKVHAEDS